MCGVSTGVATELRCAAQAQVGGKLAQVGARLIDSLAKKMSDDFFEAFRQQLAPLAAQPAAATNDLSWLKKAPVWAWPTAALAVAPAIALF